MLAEGVNSSNELQAFKASADGKMLVSVTGALSSATFTRPADTTAYAARDVVSTGAGALLTFANVVATAAGSGTIVKARLMTDQSANTAQYRLHLFHTAPTAIADNAPYTMLYSNAGNRVGMIDFTACATEGTGSTAAASMRPSSDGNSLPPNLAFKCAAASTTLYGILETLTAFTPASAQNFFVELETE